MKKWWAGSVISITMLLVAGCSNISQTANVFSTNIAEAATAVSPEPAQIEYAFTQEHQHPEELLNGVIDRSTNSLDIAIYSFTERSIVASILNAKKRNVAVRIITDEQQAKGKTQKEALNQMVSAGISVKVNRHSGLMHEKVTVADRAVVTTGSFNYSAAASTRNDEVLVVIRDARLAKEWSEEFETMWQDTDRFKNYKSN